MLMTMARCRSLLLAWALAGCGHTTLEHPPAVPNPAVAATLVIVRPKGLIAAGVAQEVTFDGFSVGRIGPGATLAFDVPPGPHQLGVITSSVAIPIEAGKCYYFRVAYSTRMTGAGVERLTRDEALDDGAELTGPAERCTSSL
jgi:hypothetical protein